MAMMAMAMAMAGSEEGRRTYTTDAIRYSIGIRERQYPVPEVTGQCVLVVVIIGTGRWPPIQIPCTYFCRCSGEVDEYYRDHETQLLQRLRWEYGPVVSQSPRAIIHVTHEFSSVLRSVNAAHRCEGLTEGAQFNPCFDIHISIAEFFENPTPTPLPTHLSSIYIHEDVTERVIRLSLGEGKPATSQSVVGLYQQRLDEQAAEGDAFETRWNGRSLDDRQCTICVEEIETRGSSLKMPCSHVFHQNCLYAWLLRSHFCPLCRFKMPFIDPLCL